MNGIEDSVLVSLERQYEAGLTSGALLDVCGAHGIPLTEATLRKYVQLGLLPRSVRVGRKGKHKGSLGVYPVRALRQLLRIKEMLAESYSIEEIRQDFLFVRTDLEQLEQTLGCIFVTLSRVLEKRARNTRSLGLGREMTLVERQGRDLVARLVAIESQLTQRAPLQAAGVGRDAARARAS
jgi:DNA-binding transcriptional MerR regulator